MNNRLNNQVAIVTGAGSGLGAATARALAGAGCAVACVDINAAPIEQLCGELQARDSKCMAHTCDVSDADAVFGAVETVAARFDRLDIVVNCAAIDHTLGVDDLTVEQWDRVLGINLRGPFLFAKAAMPIMRRQRRGQIVNIASTAATRAWANASAYHASKWGLVGLSRALGVEGRPDNIRVTTIIPGGMRTHFFDRFAAQGIPIPDERNLQDPATVAETIVFALCLPEQSVMQEVLITPLTESSWP
ncbi:MAG TPA: SDR family oxidoreductase [Roseiflexaceae bacterium]|nr:SDR family oxidoreductase [Roseiflexaceae bacterium]